MLLNNDRQTQTQITMKLNLGYRLSLLPFLLLFSFCVSVPVLGYEVDSILMYDDIDPISSSPVGLGEVFLTDSGYAYCWVNLTDVDQSHVARFDWYTPVGELHASHNVATETPGPGESFPSYAFHDNIEIHGKTPASNPGQWTVSVYVDGSLIGSREFMIVDYDAIISRTDALEDQVAEIVSAFQQLISNYDTLQEGYEELLSDYNELLDTYDDLTITYEDQISNYNEILSDKQALQEEYDSLAAVYEGLVLTTNQLTEDYNDVVDVVDSLTSRLNNSRTMTYASAALAVVFLGAAVYAYMKK